MKMLLGGGKLLMLAVCKSYPTLLVKYTIVVTDEINHFDRWLKVPHWSLVKYTIFVVGEIYGFGCW